MSSQRCGKAGQESGFTLIELLIVLVILSILMAIAVPSYLGFRARAADTAAKANLRAASTAASSYATDNTGVAGDADNNAATRGFQGMTTARLRLYDRGIKAAGAEALSVFANAAVTNVNTFCIRNTIAGRPWSVLGPGITQTSFKNNLTCT